MNREFKGIWIPKHIWLNKDLSISEMFILAEIESYDNDFGCVATNKTLCEDLRIQPSTVSGIIKSLEEKGFIQVEYKNYNTFEGRKITMCHDPFGNPKGASEKSGGASEKSIPSNIFSNTPSVDTKVSNIVELPTSTTTEAVLNDKDKCHLFVQAFNSKKVIGGKKSKYQSTTKICSALKNRLKNYTSKELLKVLDLALKDELIKKKYITPEYILRENIIERYLNTQEEDQHTSSKSENYIP